MTFSLRLVWVGWTGLDMLPRISCLFHIWSQQELADVAEHRRIPLEKWAVEESSLPIYYLINEPHAWDTCFLIPSLIYVPPFTDVPFLLQSFLCPHNHMIFLASQYCCRITSRLFFYRKQRALRTVEGTQLCLLKSRLQKCSPLSICRLFCFVKQWKGCRMIDDVF